MPTPCDAIVIGAGQAGPFLAAKLAEAGRATVLIEREHLGGTCVNDGCIPTKTLIASARAAHVARRGADFGVVTGPVRVDFAAVMARKNAVVAQSIAGLTQWLTKLPNLRLVRGSARFSGAHEVEVDGERLQAPQIFVNVGGRAVHPDWPGIDRVRVLDNSTMMTLAELPAHLLVVGGSYIGLEFAQMFRRFGSQVTVLEAAERLIAREDADVSQEVQAILEREGIVFHLGVRDASVRREGARIRVAFRSGVGSGGSAAHEVDGSHLLAAIGRRPNTDGLALERAGVATDARGFIRVDEQLRTSAEGIWALGDVNGRGAFTHTSYNDHEIVAANLLHGGARSVAERIPAYALFTDPPLARVGRSEAEVRASGRPALIGVLPMARVGRARERGETQGFMKVLVDAQTQQILGAALLGIEADEAVHGLLDAMAGRLPYTAIRDAVHIHPTVSELIPTLLADLKPLQPLQS